MGIIKAASHAVGTGLSDQWLEALEPDNMGAQTVFAKGVQLRKGTGENGKGSDNMVTEGSPGYTAFSYEWVFRESSKGIVRKDPLWRCGSYSPESILY